MLKACWLWFVILKKYGELTRPKIESHDPIFFTGTWACSWVSRNDRLLPCGGWPQIRGWPQKPCWHHISDLSSTCWICWCPTSTSICNARVWTEDIPITKILPPRTPDIIAHWQVAPPARPPSRWLPHMILTEPCCSFPDIPNMGWHNKKIF